MLAPDKIVSVIVPVYCESESLCELVDRIVAVFSDIGRPRGFEIIFVDDGSTDDTPAVIDGLRHRHSFVRNVRLRRNCGKSLALMAGFREAAGEVIVTMDGDLQDHPEDIPVLLAELDRGFDLVNGWRTRRQDQLIRKLGSQLYNGTIRRLTGLNLQDQNCGMKAYRRRLIRALIVFGQYHRYIPLQAHFAGFKVTEAPVQNSSRRFGSSKFITFRYQGLFDLLSLMFTQKYALNPMHFFGVVSSIIMIPSVILLAYFIFEQFLYLLGFGQEHMVANRPLLTFSLFSFLFGVFVFLTGFICDFILHHLIRNRIDDVIDLMTERDDSVGEGG